MLRAFEKSFVPQGHRLLIADPQKERSGDRALHKTAVSWITWGSKVI
jgi:hypothetical protein